MIKYGNYLALVPKIIRWNMNDIFLIIWLYSIILWKILTHGEQHLHFELEISTRIWNSDMLFISSVTWDKSLNISEIQFPHIYSLPKCGNVLWVEVYESRDAVQNLASAIKWWNNSCSVVLLWGLKVTVRLSVCLV